MAGYPVAAGHPQLGGSYIPIPIYVGRLLVAFYAVTILSQITNTDYEGTLKEQGQTVRIRTLPDFQFFDYDKGAGLRVSKLAPSYVDLQVNRGTYFNVAVNNLDVQQSDINFVPEWAKHGGLQMAEFIEQRFFADFYTNAHAKNSGATAGLGENSINLGTSGSPRALTEINITKFISDCAVCLTLQKVPPEQRWIVLPSMLTSLLKRSELQNVSTTGDAKSTLRTNEIGMLHGMRIFESTLLSKTAAGNAWNVLFGHKIGAAFYTTYTENRTLENTQDFGKLLQGLAIYDWGSPKPEAIGHAVVTLA